MKTQFVLFMLLFAWALQFCTGTKKVAVTNPAPEPLITYTKDIAPVIQARCTPCHFPEQGKKKFLDTYAAVKTNFDDILTRIQLPETDEEFMPFKSKKEPLSDSLILVFKQWKLLSMPE
ncbi:MAG: hypothetical protein KF852_06650 [Saprospiraceae bacterium]|nr:hypothetical protein [Saprospiraceae bacterium]